MHSQDTVVFTPTNSSSSFMMKMFWSYPPSSHLELAWRKSGCLCCDGDLEPVYEEKKKDKPQPANVIYWTVNLPAAATFLLNFLIQLNQLLISI